MVKEIVKLLINNGANIHAGDEEPLIKSCKSGNYDLVKLLLELGADPSVQIFEPLTIAREMGYIKIQKWHLRLLQG